MSLLCVPFLPSHVRCRAGRVARTPALTVPKTSYIIMQHYLLLSRNLLYTGLTRAKKLAILVGPTRAIGLAIKRATDRQRYTALAERLQARSGEHVLRGTQLLELFREIDHSFIPSYEQHWR